MERDRLRRRQTHSNFTEDLKPLLYGIGAPSHPDITNPIPSGRLPPSASLNPSPNAIIQPSSDTYLRHPPTKNSTHPPTPLLRSSGPNFTNNTGQHTMTSDLETDKDLIPEPFPETLRVLDTILTTYIISLSSSAARIAAYSGRTKLKLSDFEYVMRKDPRGLGRVQEMFRRRKRLEGQRKAVMGADQGMGGLGGGGIGGGGESGGMAPRLGMEDLMELGGMAGEEGTGRGKGRGKGRRRRRGRNADDGDEDEINEPAGRGRGAKRRKAGNAVGGIDGDGDGDGDDEGEDAAARMQADLFRDAGTAGVEEDIGDVDVDIDEVVSAHSDEEKEGSVKKKRRVDVDMDGLDDFD